MENRVLFKRYRLSLGRNDLPVQLHRTPTSVTYRAQEIGTGREVALERVTADIPTGAFRDVLESEAAIAQQINHLNVPALYDFGFDEGELIFVTEYLEGRTAAAWVAARGPLAPPAVLRVTLQIVSAMGAMAFDRIYHHALNPENIIFLTLKRKPATGRRSKFCTGSVSRRFLPRWETQISITRRALPVPSSCIPEESTWVRKSMRWVARCGFSSRARRR